jgi:preprotein translocase subunit SecF
MTDVISTAGPSGPGARPGLWRRLNDGTTDIDFYGRRNRFFLISGLLILAGVLSLGFRQLELGMEFAGGVAWEFPAGEMTTGDTRAVLDGFGLGSQATIQTLRTPDGSTRLRAQVGELSADQQSQVQRALAERAGVEVNDVNLFSVGASWSSEITRAAVRALVIFFVALFVYLTLRFEWKMAVAALVAVVHDVVLSVGVYSLFQFTVTPATVIAFLTILGFSLYDTVVVFDKVHENARRLSGGKVTYAEVVNLSTNQMLMRSINTTVTSLLPVIALLVVGAWLLGAIALQDFAVALLVGLVTGTYSSIFIAAPVLAMMKEREPRYRAARQRIERAAGSVAAPDLPAGPSGPSDGAPARGAPAGSSPSRPVPAGSTPIPPRPRKKKRR